MRRKCVKVPLVLQMEAAECGAACLGMVLGYHEHWVPLETLRQDTGVSRDGSNALYMMRAADAYGLKSKIKRSDVNYLKNEASYPCILHWQKSHFVVLAGFRGNHARIYDPAHGAELISIEELTQKYSGVVLTFTTGESFVKVPKPPVIRNYVKARMTKMAPAAIFVALSTLIIALHSIITPVFSRLFVDHVLMDNSWDLMGIILGGMSILIVVKLALEALRSKQQLHVEAYFAAQANTSFLWHVLRLPIRFFQHRHIGDIAVRQAESESISYVLIQQLVPVVLNTVMIALYLVVLFCYQVHLALVGMAAVLVNLLTVRYVMQRSIELMRVQKHDHSHMVGQTYNCIEQIETLKASGAENGFFQKWAGAQAQANMKSQKQVRMLQGLYASSEMISSLSNVFILILGASLIIQGRFTPGMLLAFQAILAVIAQPMQQIHIAGQSLQNMTVSIERTDDIFQVPPDVPDIAQNADAPGRLVGEIELRNVSFGYNQFQAPLFSGVNIHIRPGERVAVVGKSGSGKSTLAHLACGLYAPWQGQVYIDGQPLATIDNALLRSSLAVVSQENHLFSATIEDNLRLWDQSIPFENLTAAAKDAQVDSLIETRQNGFQERLLSGGIQFSGGQRQQLEIARALAANPSILVLDEATSALDAETEAAILTEIKKRGMTLLIVAHRLSTIRDCDKIVVVQDGCVAETGTHEELMAQKGIYEQLIRNN